MAFFGDCGIMAYLRWLVGLTFSVGAFVVGVSTCPLFASDSWDMYDLKLDALADEAASTSDEVVDTGFVMEFRAMTLVALEV